MEASLAKQQQRKLSNGYDLMHKTLMKSMNSYAIVLSILLATSYSGFSQAPKPLIDDSSTSSLHSSNWQKTFNYFNGFSFFSSVTALLFYASSSCSPLQGLDTRSPWPGLDNSSGNLQVLEEEEEVDKKLRMLASIVPKFLYVVLFFGVSLTCCVFAYISAGLSAFPQKLWEQLSVIITGSIGSLVYAQALCICCSDAYHLVRVNLRQNQKLWEAMKRENLCSRLLCRYVDHLCSRFNQASDAASSSSSVVVPSSNSSVSLSSM